MSKLFKLSIFILSVCLPLQAITVDQVLDDFSKTLDIPSIQGTFKVQLISKNGDIREIEARAYQKLVGDKQNNRLFIFDFPPTVRGTGLLVHSFFDGRQNNMWIYLPAVRRIKRIALESSGGGYFMGSDFTYRDLINNDYNKLDYELKSDVILDGNDCYVVKAWGQTPEIQQDNGYSYILSYHWKDNLLLYQREYYDLSGELLKVYRVGDFLEFDPYIYPTEMIMTNVQNGHKSVLLVTDVSTEEIPDRFFTTRFLQNN